MGGFGLLLGEGSGRDGGPAQAGNRASAGRISLDPENRGGGLGGRGAWLSAGGDAGRVGAKRLGLGGPGGGGKGASKSGNKA